MNIEMPLLNSEPQLNLASLADQAQATIEITLPEGLIGCEMWQRFVLEIVPDTAPLMLLHSLDEERLSFIVADPQVIAPDYQLQLSDADRVALGNPAPEALVAIVILNPAMQAPSTRVTANLLGPVTINLMTGMARQVIQPDHSAHYLVGEMPLC